MENENKYFIRIDEVSKESSKLLNVMVRIAYGTDTESVFEELKQEISDYNEKTIGSIRFIAAFNKV